MYSTSKFNSQLFSLIVLLLPTGAVQNFYFAQSSFSFSFFLVLLLCLLLYGSKILIPSSFFIACTATAYLLNADAFTIFPFARSLASTCYLLPITLALFYPSRRVFISESRLKFLMNYILIAALCISSYFIYCSLYDPNVRISFLFDEPTRLGLFLIGVGSSFLIGAWPHSNSGIVQYFRIITISFFIVASAILTGSSHFASLLIAFAMIQVYFLLSSLYGRQDRGKSLSILFFLGLLANILYSQIIYTFLINNEKLTFLVGGASSGLTKNLSSLSWLSGYSDAFKSIQISPFFGFGSGSYGHTSFNSSSDASAALMDLVGHNLNQYDGYSLFFKLLFELGPFLSIFIVVWLFIRYLSNIKSLLILNQSNSSFIPGSRYLLQLYIFGLIVIVGALIKEPTLTSFPGYFLSIPLILCVGNPPSRSKTRLNQFPQQYPFKDQE